MPGKKTGRKAGGRVKRGERNLGRATQEDLERHEKLIEPRITSASTVILDAVPTEVLVREMQRRAAVDARLSRVLQEDGLVNTGQMSVMGGNRQPPMIAPGLGAMPAREDGIRYGIQGASVPPAPSPLDAALQQIRDTGKRLILLDEERRKVRDDLAGTDPRSDRAVELVIHLGQATERWISEVSHFLAVTNPGGPGAKT
jgi:hypothetical protein